MRLWKALVLGGACVLTGSGAVTASVNYNINTVFSGAQAAGYVSASFTQEGSNVRLRVESHLGSGEFLSNLAFNYDPFATLAGSGATAVSGSFGLPAYTTGSNFYQADGDGQYDVRLEFSTSGPSRFDGADVFEMLFLNATEGNFFALSNPAGGHGPFHAAGHIQGIGPSNGDSGWHRDGELVPLPAPVYAGGGLLALMGLVRFVRRRNG